MISKRENVNVKSQLVLPAPEEFKQKYSVSDAGAQTVARSRDEIRDILDGKSSRLLVVMGPCSIHHIQEAFIYAQHLRNLSEQVNDKMLLVMRAYFEKPRTILGWKGLIYDPDLNDEYNISKGIGLGRKLLLELVNMGVPVASEILDPIITQYIADLVSWAAIGARTTESQPHRQLVSGLSMPTGFKNTTDGSIQVAVEAIKAAVAEHAFIGIGADGHAAVFKTRGNPYAHMVLRGGAQGPNYGSEYIAFARELMRKQGVTPNIVVDCSHANSHKKAMNQIQVAHDIVDQIAAGEKALAGIMLESNLKGGRQNIVPGRPLNPGVSITDECIGWDDTENLIHDLYKKLP